MNRVVALALSMVLFGGTSAWAGTIYFTGSDDARPLVAASGDLSLSAGSFLTSGTGKSTNLVTEFAEVNATSLAGMGTLTVILTEPSTSGWLHINLYTASGGEIQVGIGDNLVDDTISVYLTIDGTANHEVPNSDGAVGYRLSSDGSAWSIESTMDYGQTWIDGLSWDMASLPGGLTGDRVIDVITVGAYGATAGYRQISWECADFDDLNAPNPSSSDNDEGNGKAAEDIVIADFEGENYGDWTVDGEAFGSGPAKGTLPEQMDVSGYEGEGLANSFVGGDGSIGKLTSPKFTIERDFINFLIGGGAHGESASISLELFWKEESWIVRSASGVSAESGGSGKLDWEAWDVSKFKGLEAQIQIVDEVTGRWGHITVDQIVQSDRSFVVKREDFTRELEIDQDYLHFPVQTGGQKRLVKLQRAGTSLREFTIEFAPGEPDFWVYLETHDFRGQTLILVAEQKRGDRGNILDRVTAGAKPKDFDTFFKEKLRPQYHFSSPRGWNNDPNGMVYYRGEYHLFYQRNPFGWDWGNMTWGHAVSKDMVHWKHLPDALHPDATGEMFSGTAVVDKDNTAGFKTGDEDPILLFYTSAGGINPWSKGVPHTQSIAYSNDRGRTFTKYAGNPIIEHIRGGNRDPKVLWHEPTKQWCMVLYLDEREMGFFTSDNLKDWTEHSRIKGFHECPELFELPVDGDEGNMKWVLHGALGDYLIGDFDGREFKPETEIIKYSHSRYFYASQTFSNIPTEDGRRIQIGWGRYIDTPGMPFNQMMTFPVTLSLRTTKDGIRMCPMPIREIEKLYKSEKVFEELKIEPGSNLLTGFEGDLFDIDADIEILEADRVGFRIRGVEIAYDARTKTLRSSEISVKDADEAKGVTPTTPAKLEASGGRIQLRILVDTTSIEVFANNGEVFMPLAAVPEDGQAKTLELFAEGGAAKLWTLEIRELESIW